MDTKPIKFGCMNNCNNNWIKNWNNLNGLNIKDFKQKHHDHDYS